MTPGARLAAAIGCLEAIDAGQAAEQALTRWARASRYAGSKDRAAVRDHVFDVLRAKDSCARLGGSDAPRALVLGLCALQDMDAPALFAGGTYDPAALSDVELQIWTTRAARMAQAQMLWNMPAAASDALLATHRERALDIALTLRDRAPVDVRVNLRKATLDGAQAALLDAGITSAPCAISKTALRITEGARKLRLSKAFEEGLVELQDAGSQALVDHLMGFAAPRNPARILDFCAGGGGKSLAMAAQYEAQFVAHDISAARMQDIPARAARAGVQIDISGPAELAGYAPFDLVLCDAPCTGSGAWRRAPDAKWRFTAEQLDQMTQMQRQVLADAAPLVAPGGLLAYATCSVFDDENEALIARVLPDLPRFEQVSQFSIVPTEGADGFFLSILESK